MEQDYEVDAKKAVQFCLYCAHNHLINGEEIILEDIWKDAKECMHGDVLEARYFIPTCARPRPL